MQTACAEIHKFIFPVLMCSVTVSQSKSPLKPLDAANKGERERGSEGGVGDYTPAQPALPLAPGQDASHRQI